MTINTEGWKKAHRVLFSMALRHQLTPVEYIEACRYWDDLYAGYRTDLDPECPTCGSQYCAAGARGCAGA